MVQMFSSAKFSLLRGGGCHRAVIFLVALLAAFEAFPFLKAAHGDGVVGEAGVDALLDGPCRAGSAWRRARSRRCHSARERGALGHWRRVLAHRRALAPGLLEAGGELLALHQSGIASGGAHCEGKEIPLNLSGL